jgi:hypothetical protein
MKKEILDDKSVAPNESQLKDVLGKTFQLWNSIKEYISDNYRPTDEQWCFSGKNYGWSLRLKHKKRTVLYLIPCKGYFMVAFTLGEKAVTAAQKSTLPKFILDIIKSARKYVEGRGIRIEVKQPHDIENIKKLTEIKMAN